MAVPNSCTVLNTVLSSRVSRVGRVSAMVSVRFSGMFNMVQEFGTAVYRIAEVWRSNLVARCGVLLPRNLIKTCMCVRVPVSDCVYC